MDKEEILRQTNGGLDVFRHYVPGEWKAGRMFLNPFYKDTKPSFNIFRDKKSGEYRMKDFGDPDYTGDCFTLVAMLEGKRCADRQDFVTVMEDIIRDLNLTVTPGRSTAPTVAAPVTRADSSRNADQRHMAVTAEHPLTATELDWWAMYGITSEVLNHFRVTGVTELSFQQKRWQPNAAEPVFLYRFSDREACTKKTYAPKSKTRFLYINKVSDELFGFDLLPSKGETVVLTGGEKDVMTLAALGIPAFCLNSETAVPDELLLKRLKERFKHIIVLYDVDETGLKQSEQLSQQYGLIRVLLPLKGDKAEKDVSDYARIQLAAGVGRDAVATQLQAWIKDAVWAEEEKEFAPYLISYARPPEVPEAVLSINHMTVASAGGLVCITGGSGTGKSNYAAALLSGTLNTVLGEVDTLGMHVSPNFEQKAVLLFDTEQAGYQSYSNLDRLIHRAGVALQPENLQVMNLCPISRRDRETFIEHALMAASHHFGGVYCAVIDGLADLIGSANDEDEAVRIVEWAHRLAEKYHMVLITIVHTAGLPEKVRGHLGSELTRKASAVIDIETDKRSGNSLVKVLKMREGSVREAGVSMFGWDNRTGMHVSMG